MAIFFYRKQFIYNVYQKGTEVISTDLQIYIDQKVNGLRPVTYLPVFGNPNDVKMGEKHTSNCSLLGEFLMSNLRSRINRFRKIKSDGCRHNQCFT